jgi:hypothetical protein
MSSESHAIQAGRPKPPAAWRIARALSAIVIADRAPRAPTHGLARTLEGDAIDAFGFNSPA